VLAIAMMASAGRTRTFVLDTLEGVGLSAGSGE
jgi:hypothetical protein